MFAPIANLVTRRGWLVVSAWVAVAAALWAYAPAWTTVSRDDDVRFFPPNYPSVIGQGLLERGFPNDVSSSDVEVLCERPNGALTVEDTRFIDHVSRELRSLMKTEPTLGLKKVIDRNEPVRGARHVVTLKDDQGRPTGAIAVTVIQLRGTFASKEARLAVERIDEEITKLRKGAPDGLLLWLAGSAAVGRDSNEAANASIDVTTLATIVLVIVILLAVYRSPVLAMIPLATIALSVWASLRVISMLTLIPSLEFQVINITKVFVVVVLFGAGTDYCLFLIARYREELIRGRVGRDALAEAIRQVGGALVASAGTVIIGLGMLWFSTFSKIQYTGPSIALSLAMALFAALTLAPVLLNWLGKAVFWPFRPPHHEAGADPEAEYQEEFPLAGFWARASDWIARYPATILAGSLLVLIPFAIIGSRSRSSYDQLADLGPNKPSVQGARAFRRYFTIGELGPSRILIHHPEIDFTVGSERGKNAVEELSRQLASLPNVVEVRSVSRPLGKPGRQVVIKQGVLGGIFDRVGLNRRIEQGINEAYVGVNPARDEDRNHITRIDVVFGTSPFSEESIETLARAREVVQRAAETDGVLASSRPVTIGVSGVTVQIADLQQVTQADQRRMYVLVTLGVYLILVALLRRPIICLYLIVTVVLGYLASLGLTELVFRAFHSGPEPWTGLDWKVGFFLFVILVAVGEDYNIFLMARVIEEEKKYGPIEGTRRAVAHTGGIISSCGVIMAGTFGSMLLASLTSLRELGFALGMGVLLDTFVVRPILVPAFVVLVHKARGERPFPPSAEESREAQSAEVTSSSV